MLVAFFGTTNDSVHIIGGRLRLSCILVIKLLRLPGVNRLLLILTTAYINKAQQNRFAVRVLAVAILYMFADSESGADGGSYDVLSKLQYIKLPHKQRSVGDRFLLHTDTTKCRTCFSSLTASKSQILRLSCRTDDDSHLLLLAFEHNCFVPLHP